jgi:hypothetical protein
MEAGKASRSAMGSGLLRAARVREDRPPRVFEDTRARQLLDAAAGSGGAGLFGAGRLRDRYLRGRPDLPLYAATVIAVATV